MSKQKEILRSTLYRIPEYNTDRTNVEEISLARELGDLLNSDVENGYVWVYNNVLDEYWGLSM